MKLSVVIKRILDFMKRRRKFIEKRQGWFPLGFFYEIDFCECPQKGIKEISSKTTGLSDHELYS